MDWALAIRRNREQIRSIVLALFALAGLRPGRSLTVGPDGRPLLMLPRPVVAAIMLVLRPAESCVRRLIVIAAHGLVAKPQKSRDFVILGHRPRDPVGTMPDGIIPSRAFKLFDPLKTFGTDGFRDTGPVWESGVDLKPAYSSSLAAG